jgi:hypothetical protein
LDSIRSAHISVNESSSFVFQFCCFGMLGVSIGSVFVSYIGVLQSSCLIISVVGSAGLEVAFMHHSLLFFSINNFVTGGLLVAGSIVLVILLVSCRGIDNRFVLLFYLQCFKLMYLFALLRLLHSLCRD